MELSKEMKELARLRILNSLGILDTPREPSFDDLALIAATVGGVPIALINFIEAGRQWTKAGVGFDLKECRREDAMCNEVVRTSATVVSEDAASDPRFQNNVFVKQVDGIRFYAGVPLVCRGQVVGSLCVIDLAPHTFGPAQRAALEALARQANDQLELRLALQELSLFREELERENTNYHKLFKHLLGTTGATTDISEHKRGEGQIQLLHSARMDALGEMSAGLAHEINNPLAIIRGTAQMFVKAAQNGELTTKTAQDAARRIESTVLRITRVIGSLRSFARDGSNAPFLPARLSKVVDDAVVLVQSRFLNAGARLEIEIADSELTIECRDFQIAQVIVSLLNNAFDAVAGGTDKRVRLQIRDLGPYAEIRVIDSGEAKVAPDMREKIMEPFFTTKSVGTGMGLGLSLSKGLIEAHNGLLLCEEDDGRTCFTVTIPKKHAASAA